MVKTYHAHLEKQDQLNELLNNPNARVASGKKGKEVMQKIMAKKNELKAETIPAEASSEDSIDTLIKAAKAKKEQKSEAGAMSAYQAPLLIQQPVTVPVQVQPQQPNYTYALIEPEQPKQVTVPVAAPAPQPQQYWYPNFEVSAPIPMPQPVIQKTLAVRQ
jgi:hypothetical protein|mmetsp:Transcript_5555/g.7404  ORF Transcript_5555/g.7404 Transcript_5555/m.7404 type:complete len:161 (-) Transcript_5555:235-717(-)